MKNLVLATLLLCTVLLPAIPGLAADLEVKRETGSISEFSLRDAVLFDMAPNTRPGNPIASTPVIQRKNPWLAFGLSFVVTGLGQVYNGQTSKGVIQFVMAVGGYTTFLLAVEDDIVYTDGTVVDVDDDNAIGGLGILVAAGAALWSIIDAPIAANNINKQAQLQAHALNQKGYSVSPFVKRNQLGAKFALRF